eukprot:3862059-Amphidinium_carterae.1
MRGARRPGYAQQRTSWVHHMMQPQVQQYERTAGDFIPVYKMTHMPTKHAYPRTLSVQTREATSTCSTYLTGTYTCASTDSEATCAIKVCHCLLNGDPYMHVRHPFRDGQDFSVDLSGIYNWRKSPKI